MDKIKICQAIDSYFPAFDGAISVADRYADKLNAKENVECKILAPAASKKSGYKDKVSYNVLRCKSVKGPAIYRLGVPSFDVKIKERVQKEKFDIYHVHSPFSIGSFCVKRAKQEGVPIVATLHTKYYDDIYRIVKIKWLSRLVLKIIMRVYNRVDGVWTVSEASKQVLKDYGYKGDVVVVRNATDLVCPNNPQDYIDRANNEFNLKGKKNVLLFVGRIVMYKNLAMLVEALKILKDKRIKFTFVFAGGGFDIKLIQKMVTKLGLDKECLFTGDIKDRTLLQALYLRSDLFVFPSVFDMSALVKFEAAAHSLPAVLINKSCTAEQVVDNENGFLCENSAESLANKLIKVLSNPKRIKEVGENAYHSIYRNWDMAADEVLEKYKEIIKDFKAKKAEADLNNEKCKK